MFTLPVASTKHSHILVGPADKPPIPVLPQQTPATEARLRGNRLSVFTFQKRLWAAIREFSSRPKGDARNETVQRMTRCRGIHRQGALSMPIRPVCYR